MKNASKSLTLCILTIALAGCSKKQSHVFSSLDDTATVAQLKQFVAEKIARSDAATNEPAPGFAPFFAAAKKGDWLAISNAFEALRKHAGQYQGSYNVDERLQGPRWEAVKEVWGAFQAFGQGDEKYPAMFGNDIIQSIPPGSIYFGGTDPGRFVVTAMEKSQVDGDPFFALTQNALADPSYLDYLRSIYGGKIYIPTAEDSQKAFDNYSADAGQRLEHDRKFPKEPRQVKAGENVTKGADGKPVVSGQIAVMEINGLITKVIFDKNPDHEFYVEESFPLDWMFPHLEPHGLIMKINREPLAQLSEDVLQGDHDYWQKLVGGMIGDWLTDDTPVKTITDFAERVYLHKDLKGFTGDPQFVRVDLAPKMFSKLRSSIGGVYSWRLGQPPSGGVTPAQYIATDEAERARMEKAADFAFKQSLALCPGSPEAVYRYAQFLVNQKRVPDALLIAQTAARIDPANGQFKFLVQNLSRMR